jgi:hypothetical protein
MTGNAAVAVDLRYLQHEQVAPEDLNFQLTELGGPKCVALNLKDLAGQKS